NNFYKFQNKKFQIPTTGWGLEFIVLSLLQLFFVCRFPFYKSESELKTQNPIVENPSLIENPFF
ncbi:MAG: hypothetical protein ACKPKO_20960, partial [Candidatus Fonsibacter sp.]